MHLKTHFYAFLCATQAGLDLSQQDGKEVEAKLAAATQKIQRGEQELLEEQAARTKASTDFRDMLTATEAKLADLQAEIDAKGAAMSQKEKDLEQQQGDLQSGNEQRAELEKHVAATFHKTRQHRHELTARMLRRVMTKFLQIDFRCALNNLQMNTFSEKARIAEQHLATKQFKWALGRWVMSGTQRTIEQLRRNCKDRKSKTLAVKMKKWVRAELLVNLQRYGFELLCLRFQAPAALEILQS